MKVTQARTTLAIHDEAESTRLLMTDREALQLRVSELEVVNKRLTDMLWGRRSERRTDNPQSPLLKFGDDDPSVTGASSAASSADGCPTG